MGQRGAVWRGAWTIACVFLSAYIAFDVLDLDGSQLHFQSGVALTVESASAEAERISRGCPIPLALRQQLSLLAPRTTLTPRPARMPDRPVRAEHLLPRGQLARGAPLSPSADPV